MGLGSNAQDRIRKKIAEKLLEDPYAGRPLHGVLEGKCWLRIGDYRVVYEVDDDKKGFILSLSESVLLYIGS